MLVQESQRNLKGALLGGYSNLIDDEKKCGLGFISFNKKKTF